MDGSTEIATTIEEARAQAEPASPNAAPRHRLAELLIAERRWDEAEETVRETLRRFPRNPRAQSDLRTVVLARQQARQRAEAMDTAAARRPAPDAETRPAEPEAASAAEEAEDFWQRQTTLGELPVPEATIFETQWNAPPLPDLPPPEPPITEPPRAMMRPSLPWAAIAGIAAAILLAGFLIARSLTAPIPNSLHGQAAFGTAAPVKGK